MKLCAYCGKNKKLTREHVIPDWYINVDRSPDDRSFSERIPHKFANALIVKDVCGECNGIHLSKLDAYGKELYGKYFQKYVYKGEAVDFEYDYQRLLKWLIKCSYNSARVHNADLEVLSGYADILITEKELPQDIIVFCSLIAPANTAMDEPTIAEREDSSELYEPRWFRLGVFRIPDFDSIDYCFRTVIIGSYAFFLVLPKLRSKYMQQKRELLLRLSRDNVFGVKINQGNQTKLAAPNTDAMSSFFQHVASNPIAYELDDTDFSKHIKEEDADNICYLIPREDIEAGNTKEIEDFFLYATSSREVALLFMQKVEFFVDGYNEDPRELYEIREVVNYIGKLNKIFPYWLFYQNPRGMWLKVLLACLSKGSVQRVEGKSTFVTMDTKTVGRHIERWFISLNELSHKLSISERLNRKISDDFSSIIRSCVPIGDA